jgi:hypothetical protein
MTQYPVRYDVQDYCKKYPDDQGDQDISDEDVVRPRNLKWVDREDQHEWRWDKHISTNCMPTYGRCALCWASGPSYETCVECKKGVYKPLLMKGGYILDSPTFSEKKKMHHQVARAGHTHIKERMDSTTFDHNDILQVLYDMFSRDRSRTIKRI